MKHNKTMNATYIYKTKNWKTCSIGDVKYPAGFSECDFRLVATTNPKGQGLKVLKNFSGPLEFYEKGCAKTIAARLRPARAFGIGIVVAGQQGKSMTAKPAKIPCNVITLQGPSGCGKTQLRTSLQGMCALMGYTENRIVFKEKLARGLPKITFAHPMGMNDMHACLLGVASKNQIGGITG